MLAAQRLQRAVASFQQGQLAQTEALCVDILQADRRRFDALHLLALVALQTGQTARAIELFRQSLVINRNQPIAHMNLASALLADGRPQAALASAEAALALRPDYAEGLNCRANALLDLKRPQDALASYDRALALRPDLAVLHSNRANALRDLQRPEEALDSYQRARQLQPALREALLGAAAMLKALRRGPEALACCEESLRRNPNDAEALHLRAGLALESGRAQDALTDLERAQVLQPQSAEILLDRGNALFRLDRVEEAYQDYLRALEMSPEDAQGHYNRGNALYTLQRFEEALCAYDIATARNPGLAKAHYHRGNALRKLRRPEEALESYARAIVLNPRYVEAVNGAGHAYRNLDRLPEALATYDRALQLDPCSLEALSNRSRVLILTHRQPEAIECLERLLAVAPDIGPEFHHTLGMLLHAKLAICDWRDYEAAIAAIADGIDSGRRVTPPSLYNSAGDSPDLHLRCARTFVGDNWGAITPRPWPEARTSHERVRIAYVSADYRWHPVSQLMAGVIESHDRQRFEVTAIATRQPDDSALAQRVKRAFDRFIDVTNINDRQVAALMRDLEIDIAVDLTGFTADFRTGIFAHRAAPIQVNYLGYPGTLAGSFMDYIIADRVVIPPGQDIFYGEQVVRLAHCYLPPGDRRADSGRTVSRADCGLPERGVVFCSFNNHYKIVPPFFDIWMRLMREIEGSVLWLATGPDTVRHNLAQEAARRGIDPDRLIFAPRIVDMEEHLARYRCADLFLDTLPYNAHTTASDALWAGLPVLTCLGRSFPGRPAASLLSTLGLPELIAEDLADYEARARQLALEPDLLGKLRARLQHSRDGHPAFDTVAFCRDLEAAYIEMWDRSRRGAPPASFSSG
jgi:protein O-GlcNAc transferase